MFIQNLQYKLHKLNTAQIITLSFAGVIFVGGLILWLPFCTAAGQTTSFSDAMFTATTCVCVTGLVTVTTATHWSLIGKLVILLLIQIGGIGLIALASIIFISLNKKIILRFFRLIFLFREIKIMLARAIRPIPPIWISKRITSLPIRLQ